MQKVKLYKHTIGKSEEDLKECLKHLANLHFHIRYDNTEKQYNARKRIGRDRECHVVIRKIKGGKYRAYLHIDIVVSDIPLIHRVLDDPELTERWGDKIFGGLVYLKG
jgi:hypothetical protein